MINAVADEELSEAEAAMERTDAAISVQHTPGRFNLAQWLKNGGVTLATEEITLYTDMAAGWAIQKIESKLMLAKDRLEALNTDFKQHVEGPPTEDVKPLMDEIEDLKDEKERLAQQVVDTSITFHMRAVAPAVNAVLQKKSRALRKRNKWDEEDLNTWYEVELYRAMITKMVMGTGEVDASVQEHEDMELIFTSLPPSEQEKLARVAAVLMGAVELADKREDAGFPGGSSDVDPEQ